MKDMVGVSYKTGWYLCHRVRSAMETPATKLTGNPPRRFADASRSLGLLMRLGDLEKILGHLDHGDPAVAAAAIRAAIDQYAEEQRPVLTSNEKLDAIDAQARAARRLTGQ